MTEIVPTFYSKLDPSEREIFRDWVKSHLKYGPVMVTFLKKDNSVRKMNCTLNETLVKDYEKKTERTKLISLETCPVFDIDKQEWRSFRWDSITGVEFTIQ